MKKIILTFSILLSSCIVVFGHTQEDPSAHQKDTNDLSFLEDEMLNQEQEGKQTEGQQTEGQQTEGEGQQTEGEKQQEEGQQQTEDPTNESGEGEIEEEEGEKENESSIPLPIVDEDTEQVNSEIPPVFYVPQLPEGSAEQVIPQNTVKKEEVKEEDSVLSFNFLYLLIQKFKLSEIMED